MVLFDYEVLGTDVRDAAFLVVVKDDFIVLHVLGLQFFVFLVDAEKRQLVEHQNNLLKHLQHHQTTLLSNLPLPHYLQIPHLRLDLIPTAPLNQIKKNLYFDGLAEIDALMLQLELLLDGVELLGEELVERVDDGGVGYLLCVHFEVEYELL